MREAQDDLQKRYRAIMDGAKELRLDRTRRRRVRDAYLAGAADRIAARKSAAMRRFWIADAGGGAIFFLAIGALLPARTTLALDGTTISGVVLALLYVKGPVDQLSGALSILSQAEVALRRIATHSADFQQEDVALDR